MTLTFTISRVFMIVLAILAACGLVASFIVDFLQLKTDSETVSNLLGSNLTLSGTLIAVIGIIVTFIPRNSGSARNTMLLLLFSTIMIMAISSLVVFFSYLYLGNEKNQDRIEPIITYLFVSLPLVTMVLAAAVPIAYIKQNPGETVK